MIWFFHRGSVLTIEKTGGVFDAIVFGEITPAKWMPGSDGFRPARDLNETKAARGEGPGFIYNAAKVGDKETVIERRPQ